MNNYRIFASSALAVLLCFGGCVGTTVDGDRASVEQFSFGADLGVGIGSPVTTNSTTGRTNDYQPSCIAYSTAPDMAYVWTAPSAGSYVFDTVGSSFDTILEVREYNSGTSLQCNDDISNTVRQSTVTVALSGGETVMIVVDGYGAASGPFQLNISGGGGGGGGGGGPASDLHLWLRADAGVSAPNGAQVASWVDQSGNARNASMPNPDRQPELVTGALNGRPVIHFAGSQSMYLDRYATPTAFSVFVVGRNSRTDDSFSMILGPGGNAPNNQLRWESGSEALFVGTGNELPVVTSSIGDTRVYHALSASYDGSSMTVYRDGTASSSTAFSTTGPWTLASVGSWYSSYFLVGDLAEVLIYDRALSEPERATTDAYLRGKYNLP